MPPDTYWVVGELQSAVDSLPK